MTWLRSEHPHGRGKGTIAGARDVGPLGCAKEKSDPVALTRGNRPIGASRLVLQPQEPRSPGAQERPTCVLGVGHGSASPKRGAMAFLS